MSSRFICPHCHRPVEPQCMDVVVSDQAVCRVCPECDEPIVLATTGDPSRVAQAIAIAIPGPFPQGEDIRR